MANYQELFGSTLLVGDKQVDVTEQLGGKHVLIYFSAHWCPPCRGFTPMLAEWYNTMKQEGKNVEVVFVSFDSDEASFGEYFGEMPWTAIPYAENDLKQAIAEKFEVSGIPQLTVLDAELNHITNDGREKVMAEPNAFPWK